MPAIEARGITKSFGKGEGAVRALDRVDLSVEKGEIFGLLGPNGAGKTTLISILCGILSPDGGSASVLGLDCVAKAAEVKKRINVVSGFTGVVPAMSCAEALNYYGMLYNVPGIRERAQEAMAEAGMDGLENRLTEDLSSGLKQRFMIAKALLNRPEVLIMDEPTVGLDVESAISIRQMVRGLREKGRTILLTTHNMFEAEELCDRIAFINRGRIGAVGTPRELKGRIIKERVIEIHCTREDCVARSLGGVPGVRAEIKSPRLVRVSVDHYSRMKDVLRALSACEGEVFGVSELEPTFEETYLRLINEGGKKHG